MTTHLLPYHDGEITVTADSATVTGSLTAFLSAAKPGDLVAALGEVVAIQSIEGNTSLTLVRPWPGVTETLDGSEWEYEIRPGPAWADVSDLNLRVAELARIRPAGTSVTSLAIGTGEKIFTVQSGLPFQPGAALRISVGTDVTKWMQGICTEYAGTSLTVAVALTSGETSTHANWRINYAGSPGATGATGDTGPAGASAYDVAVAEGFIGDEAAWLASLIGPTGDTGETGDTGATGAPGTDGDDGWAPVLAIESDGARRVPRVVDWTGGEGSKPATGKYVGASGLVDDIGDGVDVRGPQGTAGAGSGDMEASTYDPQSIEDDAFDRANHTGAQAISTITGLQDALDDKADAEHDHAIADVTGLQAALDGKAASSHTHPASEISDSTSAGRSVLTAADAAAQRTALGLGSLATLTPTGTPDGTKFLRDDGTYAVPAGGGGSDENLARVVGFMAMQLADVINLAQFPSADRYADSFDALTYVDVAGATDLDTSTPGVLKPLTETVTQIGADVTSQFTTTSFTYFSRVQALQNGETITKIGFHATAASNMTLKVGQRTSAGNYTVVVSQAVNHPGGGWVYFTLSSPYTIPGSGDYYVGISGTQTFGRSGNNVPRAYKSGDHTGASSGWSEDTSSAMPVMRVAYLDISDMWVATTALPLSVEPDIMFGMLLVREIDAATPNTDLMLDFSRNNGSNWVQSTLTLIRDVPIAGGVTLKLYGTNNLDVTGHAFATACRARIRTDNAKNVEAHALYVYAA